MKMPRLLFLFVSLFVAGCGSKSESAPEGEPAEALSECCTEALGLMSQMSECCRTGMAVAGKLSGCCEQGMLDTTADADRPDCCTQSRTLLAQFSACCKKTVLTGEADGCCEAMPAALLAQKPG